MNQYETVFILTPVLSDEVKLDKYAAQYAEKRRNKFAKTEEA